MDVGSAFMLLACERAVVVTDSALPAALERVAVVEDGQGAGVWRSTLKQRGDLVLRPLLVEIDELEEGSVDEVVVE